MAATPMIASGQPTADRSSIQMVAGPSQQAL